MSDLNEYSVKLLKALAHPVRLQIVKRIGREDLCVCHLNESTGFSQSNLSQHLKILKEAGVLDSRKEGLRVYYRLKNKDLLEILENIEALVKYNLQNMFQGVLD